MIRRFLLLFFIILSFQIGLVFSQEISFTAIKNDQQKNIVGFLGITQDQLGYIWLSSFNGGIYRYDGMGFVNYQHNDSNSNSIASDRTECILADSSGVIWIGTFNQGLDRYNPITNQFTHFRHDSGNRSSLSNDSVKAMLQDREGNFWIGTNSGLDLFDLKTGVFKHFTHDANDPTSLCDNQVRSIYEDHQGTLWIACGEPFYAAFGMPELGGLNRFNRIKGNFTRFQHNPGDPNSLETNVVNAVFEDSRGNFWVGTSGDGLHSMDRVKGTFTHYHYDPGYPEKLSRPPVNKSSTDFITFINEDNLGSIWIGSFSGGINRYDPATNKTTHYGRLGAGMNALPTLSRDTSFGFTGSGCWQALFLRDGQIWITTFQTFSETILYQAATVKNVIPFYPIGKMWGANTFYYNSDSILWVGTDSGLIKKNLVLRTEKIYRNDPKNPNSLSSKSIVVIRVDKDENIWLGTSGGGLNKLDPITNHFTAYRFDANIKSSLGNDTIWSMCLDHNDELWVGTQHGLDKLNKQTGSFTHFKLENERRIDFGEFVYCIREDQNNELWVGTQNGLYRVNTDNSNVNVELPNALVKSVCVDSKNEVWIGADTAGLTNEQNLYRYSRSRNRFILFTDPGSNGKIKGIFDIMEDSKKNLWISTTDAILRIDEKGNRLRIYGPGFGVHKNNFGTGDNFKAMNGKLFFGDSHGYYSFFPDDLKDNSPPRLNFTGFKLNGKEVMPSENGILKRAIWQTEAIRLAHNQNSFSFEFLGIDYQSPGEMKFLFMLENYDDVWQSYESGRRPYYFNLPPGNYTFRVRAFNADGGLTEKSIGIFISPPWWKTWWAYLIMGLFVACAIWGLIYYRSHKLLNENRLLEEKVAHRTKQLHQSLEELKSTQSQLIQSEKMASLGELTAGIAHEIQNPLNFMNNFSEVNKELIEEMEQEIDQGNLQNIKTIAGDIKKNEEKINQHGKRADAIVKGMLLHSRSSTGQKEMTDVNALADEYLRLSYHGLRAKDKNFNSTMKTDFNPAVGRMNIIPQDIGRVLLNLYNNAFYSVSEKAKRQPPGYEPSVSVSTIKVNGRVEIRVKDNGNGIPQKVLDKIFQPFFTTKPTGQGTGLGLSMSYDIVKAHGGELKVDTKEGEGAEFIVQIPEG